jgi:uncharacterized membrane protein YcaP (DUF421 family)
MSLSFLYDGPEGPLRTLIVGILAYGALVVTLRVSGKRTLSKMNAFDLVVTVALGPTLATILLSRDVPLADGVVAFLVLVALQFAITAGSKRVKAVARLAKSEPRALLYRGGILPDALRAERVLEAELQAALRQAGHTEYSSVDLVVLETDGSLSVVATVADESSPAVASVRMPQHREAGGGHD